MPGKPAKYGIKTWVACDARSSYAWKMQVYTGKPAAGGAPEKNQGMRVTLDLTKGLRGRNVTCDNFFTSYKLGQRLLLRGLTMVGTIRRNRTELLPVLLMSKGRDAFSSEFAFTPTAALVSYLRAAPEHAACRGRGERPRGQEADPRPRLQSQQRWSLCSTTSSTCRPATPS